MSFALASKSEDEDLAYAENKSLLDEGIRESLSEVLYSIVGAARADVGHIALLQKDTKYFSPLVTFGISSRAVPPLEVGHKGLSGWVYRNDRLCVWPGGECDNNRIPYKDPDIEVKQEVVIPMRYSGQTIGLLTMSSLGRGTLPESSEFLQVAADEIALIVQSEKFHNASLKLSRVFFDSLDPESICQILARSANEILETPITCVWLRDANNLYLAGWDGVEISSPESLEMSEEGGGISWSVIKLSEKLLRAIKAGTDSLRHRLHRLTVNIQDPKSGYRHPEFAVTNKLVSVISMPLIAQYKVMGVINSYVRREYSFFDEEIALLRNLAMSGGIALGNASMVAKLDSISRRKAKNEAARDIVHALTAGVSGLITRLHTISNTVTKLEKSIGNKSLVRSTLQELRQRLERLTDIARTQDLFLSRYRHFKSQSDEFCVEIDLETVLKNITSVVSHRALSKKVSITIDPPRTETSTFFWNESDIYLIFVNLIDNAVKFSRKGGRVTLCIADESGFIVIRIQDRGVGIHHDDRGRIWDVGFSTIAPGAKEASSGLGLPAVKQTLDRIPGAKVEFSSQKDRYSEFSVYLPNTTKRKERL